MAEATNQSQSSTMAQRKALDGIRVLDMTHVQAGPSATQLMAWMGADVIKVELPGRGDITRSQLRDVPNADSLYFTMLNSNKRSLTLNMKTPEGKALLEDLIQQSDVLIENFGPGVLARAGFDWEHIQDLNPRMVYASIKGFGPGPYQDCKAYENVAQCMGGAASTTGEASGMPLVTGAQIGDSGTGVHCVVGILGALLQREHSGRGQRVEVAMQDAVLNLCRVKLRDQQRLDAGPLREYPNDQFDDHVPRAGNASGGGQPGAALRCAPGGANDYVYVIIQPQGWEPLMRLCGREDLITDPEFATPEVRLKKLAACFGIIEQWTLGHTKFEVMNALNEVDVPCGPILSMKDLIGDQSMYERGFLIELEHPVRGKYVQLGSPITLSDSPVNVERSPLLGEHTNEILESLGRSPAQIAALRLAGAI